MDQIQETATIKAEELIKMRPSQDVINEIESLADTYRIALETYDYLTGNKSNARDRIKKAFKRALCLPELNKFTDFDERCRNALAVTKSQLKEEYRRAIERKICKLVDEEIEKSGHPEDFDMFDWDELYYDIFYKVNGYRLEEEERKEEFFPYLEEEPHTPEEFLKDEILQYLDY